MKNQNQNQNPSIDCETIVAFHIGRGGKFFNGGILTYIGEKKLYEIDSDLYVHPEHYVELSEKLSPDNRALLDELYANDDINAIATQLGISVYELGEPYMFDFNSRKIISVKNYENGVGTLDIDGEYDTTYTKHLNECDSLELELIEKTK